MKARIKENGKWITVDTCNEGFYDVETHDIYEPDELDFAAAFDWSAFRREAAKDFVSAMLRNNGTEQWATPDICTAAIEIADELIKELKEE